MNVTPYAPDAAPTAQMQAFVDGHYAQWPPIQRIAPHADTVFWLASGGTPMGFACGYTNPHLPDAYLIGNYECSDDPSAAAALLGAAEARARVLGKAALIGPMNGATWYAHRFSEGGQEAPFFLEHIHQPYYPGQWRAFGFEAFQHYQSNEEVIGVVAAAPTDYFERNGWKIRPFDIENATSQLLDVHALCSVAFAGNTLFSPISAADFIGLYAPLLPALDPAFIDLVYDDGQLVGLLFGIPDRYSPGQVVVKTLVRHPDARYQGLGHHLSVRYNAKLAALGYGRMVHAYMHVDNRSNRISTHLGGRLLRRHTLYKKML